MIGKSLLFTKNTSIFFYYSTSIFLSFNIFSEQSKQSKRNIRKIRNTMKLDKSSKDKDFITYDNNMRSEAQQAHAPQIIMVPQQTVPSQQQPVVPPIIIQQPQQPQQPQPIIIQQPQSSSTPQIQPLPYPNPVYIQQDGSEYGSKKKKKKKKKASKNTTLNIVNKGNEGGSNSGGFDNIFSGARFSDIKPKPKKMYSWGFSGLSYVPVALFFDMRKKYKDFKNSGTGGNTEKATLWSFFREKFTDFKGMIGDYILLGRFITSWNMEWKKLVSNHFSVGFSLNHVIFPGMTLELNTGYYHKCTAGIALRIGLDELLKISFPFKFGNFLFKINTVRLGTVDLIYILYNNGTNLNSTNIPDGNSKIIGNIFGKKIKDKSDKWFYKDPFSEFSGKLGNKLKESVLFHMIFGGMSIELGGIHCTDDEEFY